MRGRSESSSRGVQLKDGGVRARTHFLLSELPVHGFRGAPGNAHLSGDLLPHLIFESRAKLSVMFWHGGGIFSEKHCCVHGKGYAHAFVCKECGCHTKGNSHEGQRVKDQMRALVSWLLLRTERRVLQAYSSSLRPKPLASQGSFDSAVDRRWSSFQADV